MRARPHPNVRTYLELLLCREALSRLITQSSVAEHQSLQTGLLLVRNHFLTCFFHAARCPSGILDSTLLISLGPKPVAVLLCLGRVKSGP